VRFRAPRTSPRRRLIAALAACGAAASVLVAVSPIAATADPPPNPTDGQISAAAARKAALADEVGRLGAQIAQMQSRLYQLQGEMERAEQRVALALQKLQQAKDAAVQAKNSVTTARAQVAQAQRDFDSSVAVTYTSGDVQGTTGALLTASDPNVLLQRGQISTYITTHNLGAIDTLQRATVEVSNAEAAARRAVANQTAAANAAESAKNDAVAAVAAANRQKQQLDASLAASQTQFQSAQLELATLNNQRAAYVAYQAEQARLAEIRRQQELARERAAQLAAQRAAQQAAQNGGGGGGGGGGGPAPGSNQGWTQAAGRIAVQRAMSWLGWPYAWAGGNANGPTYGVCAGDGAWNDCNVRGFDCSGLVMYAWAQFPFAHYAATQYLQGSFHPSVDQLLPGDLVFWSSDGTVDGIHHVAIYIGNGNVIQAPESGSVIQITPRDQVSWGYFGATRPLT
jgi:cell wall-associated NlpC family hydrolase